MCCHSGGHVPDSRCRCHKLGEGILDSEEDIDAGNLVAHQCGDSLFACAQALEQSSKSLTNQIMM